MANFSSSMHLLLKKRVRLVQNFVTLSWWFSHKTAACYTDQCTSPSFLHHFEVSWHGLNHSLKNYGFLCNAIFCSHVRMHTNHLAMKCNLLRNIGELEIELVCRECLKRAWSGQWFFSQYCIHLLRKPVRTDLLLCDSWWQTSAQACICC